MPTLPTMVVSLVLGASSAAQASGLAALDQRLTALEQRVGRIEGAAWSAGPVLLCLDVASDLAPIHPTRAFPEGVSELSLAIEAGAAARFRELTAVFVAEDVGAAAPPETEMARAVQPAAPDQRARFRYRQEAPLPPGIYRVELLGDGAPWHRLRYRVHGAAAPSAAPSFPLELGRVWRYDFVQEAAAHARLVDGETPVGNRLTAVVEMKVVEMKVVEHSPSAGAAAARLEFRRDGVLVTQEWWRQDERGLVATRRGTDADELELDPPQPLLSARTGIDRWEWGNEALGPGQEGRQWGPLELHGPWGRAQGYVVRTEQPDEGLVYTAEREFVPGLGLVRERITTARDGHLVARQELVLRP